MNRRDFSITAATLPLALQFPDSIIESVCEVSGSNEFYAVIPQHLADRANLKTGDRIEGCFVVIIDKMV